jgi:hypothetical protein
MKQQRLQRLRRIVCGGDDNPLRRYVDRIESAVVVSLLVAFIVAAPLIAIFTVRLTGAAGAREVAAQSSWRQVPAVLTQSAGAGLIGLDGEWDTSWVTARWTAPDGAARHGLVAVGLNARAGQTVKVWATRTGQLTTPRLTEGAVIERQIIATVAATAALALLLSATAGGVRALANRRRMVAWTKEWKTIGPRWSSLR